MSWIPVAISDDISVGDVAPVRHEGQNFVIWRDSLGRLHAAEDRCPHRGVRLSLGFMREDHIACLYHGWQFNGDGRCRHIPAHPALNPPSTIALRNIPSKDRSGLVWIASDVAGAPRADVLDLWHGVRSLAIHAPVQDVRHALTIDEGYWKVSGSKILAFHVPCEGLAMVHLAVRKRDQVASGLLWLQELRGTIEGLRC